MFFLCARLRGFLSVSPQLQQNPVCVYVYVCMYRTGESGSSYRRARVARWAKWSFIPLYKPYLSSHIITNNGWQTIRCIKTQRHTHACDVSPPKIWTAPTPPCSLTGSYDFQMSVFSSRAYRSFSKSRRWWITTLVTGKIAPRCCKQEKKSPH